MSQIRKIQKNLDEINDWRKSADNVLMETAKALRALQEQLASVDEIAYSLNLLAGEELVRAKTEEVRNVKALKLKEETLQSYRDGIEAGWVSEGGEIGEKSIVCGIEFTPSGKQAHPRGDGWVSVPFTKLSADLKATLLGRSAGDTALFPENGTFKITEVFQVNAEKFKEAIEQRSKQLAEQIEESESTNG